MSDFFFNDTATTEIYTLSLHDALPIYNRETSEQKIQQFGVGNDAVCELTANNIEYHWLNNIQLISSPVSVSSEPESINNLEYFQDPLRIHFSGCLPAGTKRSF